MRKVCKEGKAFYILHKFYYEMQNIMQLIFFYTS